MRCIFYIYIIAIAVSLSGVGICLDTSLQQRASSIGSLTGGSVQNETITDFGDGRCKGCLLSSRLVFECSHENPPNDESCKSDACLMTGIMMIKCARKAEGQAGHCCQGYDPAYQVFYQEYHLHGEDAFECEDNGWEDIDDTYETFCARQSNEAAGSQGKCFLDSCSGGVVAGPFTDQGGWVCATGGLEAACK
jgi:hypothetical protein